VPLAPQPNPRLGDVFINPHSAVTASPAAFTSHDVRTTRPARSQPALGVDRPFGNPPALPVMGCDVSVTVDRVVGRGRRQSLAGRIASAVSAAMFRGRSRLGLAGLERRPRIAASGEHSCRDLEELVRRVRPGPTRKGRERDTRGACLDGVPDAEASVCRWTCGSSPETPCGRCCDDSARSLAMEERVLFGRLVGLGSPCAQPSEFRGDKVAGD